MCDILLIDDTLEILALFSTILNLAGYDVETKSNAKDALEYLENSHKSLPLLVITDVSMPEMDGFELCHLIKNNPDYKEIKVIIFTAVYPELTKRMESFVRPDDILLKPLDAKKLVNKVKEVINEKPCL